MSANLAANLTASAASTPEAIAIKLDDLEVSYAQLDDSAARVAGHLASLGVGPGDRVGLMLPNVPPFASIYYGILRLGAVVVPMNVLLKERETSFYLGDPGAQAVFAWQDFADAAGAGARDAGAELIVVAPGEFQALLGAATPFEEVAAREESDTAVILYTSGTTGTPRRAPSSPTATFAAMPEVTQKLFSMTARGRDPRLAAAVPLLRADVLAECAACARARRSRCCRASSPTRRSRSSSRDRVTLFMGVPTMYSALLNSPSREDRRRELAACMRLRRRVAAGRADAQLRAALRLHHPRGLRALGDLARRVFNHPDRERKPGSIGTPIEGVEMRLVDDARRARRRRRGRRDRDPRA